MGWRQKITHFRDAPAQGIIRQAGQRKQFANTHLHSADWARRSARLQQQNSRTRLSCSSKCRNECTDIKQLKLLIFGNN